MAKWLEQPRAEKGVGGGRPASLHLTETQPLSAGVITADSLLNSGRVKTKSASVIVVRLSYEEKT